MSHETNLPETIEASIDHTKVSPHEAKIQALKSKLLELVKDSLDVVHCAVKGNDYRGKKISRTQLYAANPIVARFSPELDGAGSGEVHLHLSIPRPKQENGKIINVKAKAVK